jgi:hypothetical protein
MTPQIGRPVQFTGNVVGVSGVFAATIIKVVSGETVDLSVVHPGGSQADLKVFHDVGRDASHGSGTWDYVPD